MANQEALNAVMVPYRTELEVAAVKDITALIGNTLCSVGKGMQTVDTIAEVFQRVVEQTK